MEDYTVVWTDKAYASLRQIHGFIAGSNPVNADDTVKELLLLSQTLTVMPRRYPIEPSLAEAEHEYRFLTKWNFKIIYTILPDDKMVLIVFAFDTRQDPQKLKF